MLTELFLKINLYQLLIDNIMSGDIKEVYDDEMFMTKLSPEAIKQRLSITKESDWLIDKRNAEKNLHQKISKLEQTLLKPKTENVKLLKLKECGT